MEERIRILAEQAGIDFISGNDGKEFAEAWLDQLEQFARLVEQDLVKRILHPDSRGNGGMDPR